MSKKYQANAKKRNSYFYSEAQTSCRNPKSQNCITCKVCLSRAGYTIAKQKFYKCF